MKRASRAAIAQKTIQIVQRGWYDLPDRRRMEIGEAVQRCLESTQYFPAERLSAVRREVLANSSPRLPTTFEVRNETTLEGIGRVLAERGGPVAALNFASAKNPGGGFLNGSQAQEESLARSSALYASQRQAEAFYHLHRASRSMLYSDAMILSPDCPIFRDDDGALLGEPRLVTFITSAAPNAGAASRNQPGELSRIPEVLEKRAELVLALAASAGCESLVLGAWGCGVFRNDPEVVCRAFANHLRGVWSGRFRHIVFSVLDTTADTPTFEAFRQSFEPR